MYPPKLSCAVQFRDPLRTSATVTYCAHPVGKDQSRFRGREKLVPDVDLAQFECRAVIDWVNLKFEVGHQTHCSHIRRVIGQRFGAKPYVKPIDPTPSGNSRVFVMTVQEPGKAVVYAVISDIAREFEIVGDVQIDAIEISVDFRPLVPSDLLRAQLHGVLTRSFWTSRDVFKKPDDRPRSVGEGVKGTTVNYLFRIFDEEELHKPGAGKPVGVDSSIWIDARVDCPPTADATFYVGAKNTPIRWRIMDKVKDQQNRRTGTLKLLGDAEKRVRVEVTLSQPALTSETGLRCLQDLEIFRFTTLQGKFFKFMLPTFRVEPEWDNRHPNLNVWLDRMKVARFLKTGILGLEWSDLAREHFRKPHLAQMKKSLRHLPANLPVRKRRAAPTTKTYIAYDEVATKIQTALRHLGERWI